MKWFGISMDSPLSIAKLSLVGFAFVAGSFGAMSFVADGDPVTPKKDTTAVSSDKQAFKSLFTANTYDASKPYITQLNPKAVPFVQDYMRREGKEFEKMKSWGRPYFELYDNILTQYSLPKELKYLSVIESHLRSGLVSWAGAVGPWQLMDYEAKRFGLRVTRAVDDRMDYYKSTHVAAKLLKELYAEFGDWLLVIAAYNGGAGRVKQAIKKAKSKDFWDLQYFLPEETRNHVKKFIGTHYIFEGSGGLTTMTAGETASQQAYTAGLNSDSLSFTTEQLAQTKTIEIGGRYLSKIVAGHLVMSIAEFNKWNPGFDKILAEGKKYMLRLPKDRMEVFEAKKGEILLESVKTILNGDQPTAATK